MYKFKVGESVLFSGNRQGLGVVTHVYSDRILVKELDGLNERLYCLDQLTPIFEGSYIDDDGETMRYCSGGCGAASNGNPPYECASCGMKRLREKYKEDLTGYSPAIQNTIRRATQNYFDEAAILELIRVVKLASLGEQCLVSQEALKTQFPTLKAWNEFPVRNSRNWKAD